MVISPNASISINKIDPIKYSVAEKKKNFCILTKAPAKSWSFSLAIDNCIFDEVYSMLKTIGVSPFECLIYIKKHPGIFKGINLNDKQRLYRAISVYENTGIPLWKWHKTNKRFFKPSDFIKIYLNPSKVELETRIKKRFNEMDRSRKDKSLCGQGFPFGKGCRSASLHTGSKEHRQGPSEL